MTHAVEPAFETVRHRIDEAVGHDNPGRIAHAVKDTLQEAMRADGVSLSPRFYATRRATHARRLLHRDHAGRYSVVVMTWGPGQGTALHDHAGIWCVECVVDGEMAVTQYDLVSQAGSLFRFEERNRVTASRGSAGCLIPPFEYHTLANAQPDRASITLHVYGGEMNHCHIFEPAGGGSYRRLVKELSYHD